MTERTCFRGTRRRELLIAYDIISLIVIPNVTTAGDPHEVPSLRKLFVIGKLLEVIR